MRPRVILITAAAVVGVLILWFLLLWGPQGNRLNAAKSRKERAEKDVNDLTVQVAQLQAIKNNSTKLLADLERLRVAIPDAPDLAQFLLDANDAATRSGVDFISVAPTPPAAATGGGPTVISLALSVDGGYFQVLDYLNRLDSLPRIVVVDNLNLNATPGEAGSAPDKLSVQITARMFTTSAPVATAGAAATPGATSGGTTTTTAAGGGTATTATTVKP